MIWGPVDLPGAGAEAGGLPTVADFDGDGEHEVGAADSTQYAVFEADGCHIFLWPVSELWDVSLM